MEKKSYLSPSAIVVHIKGQSLCQFITASSDGKKILTTDENNESGDVNDALARDYSIWNRWEEE